MVTLTRHPALGEWDLTGRRRYRVQLFTRKLVLQVEERRFYGSYPATPPRPPARSEPDWEGVNHRWRDARPGDLLPVEGESE